MSKKRGHGSHHHTGPIVHKDMTSIIHAVGGQDPHASAEHHAKNKAHGMPEGMSPRGQFDDGGEGETEGLTGGNMECCE